MQLLTASSVALFKVRTAGKDESVIVVPPYLKSLTEVFKEKKTENFLCYVSPPAMRLHFYVFSPCFLVLFCFLTE